MACGERLNNGDAEKKKGTANDNAQLKMESVIIRGEFFLGV